jgi:hypothetical protein
MSIYMNQYTYSRIQITDSCLASLLIFVVYVHSSQCPPPASTVTIDAVDISVVVLELRLDTVIISVSVVVELVVIVKESDDKAATAATPADDEAEDSTDNGEAG